IGEARPECEQLALLFGISVHEPGNFRSRSHEAHLAPQDIEQLGQLIEFEAPEAGADRRNAGVAPSGKLASGIFRTRYHGAELPDAEGLALLADTLLAEEDRAPILAPDQHPDHHN